MADKTRCPQDLTVIFDLDGTLVDTAPDLVASLNIAFEERGLPPAKLRSLRCLVNRGARAMVEAGLRANRIAVEAPLVDALRDRLLEDYWVNIDRFSRPFDGVVDVLERLKASGAVLGVCTNKRQAPSTELLTRLGILKYFSALVGGDRARAAKPNPAHLFETITQAGGQHSRSVMVGDSAADVQSATSAGIPVVVVEFGYSDRPPETLGADVLIKHYRELVPAIVSLMK